MKIETKSKMLKMAMALLVLVGEISLYVDYGYADSSSSSSTSDDCKNECEFDYQLCRLGGLEDESGLIVDTSKCQKVFEECEEDCDKGGGISFSIGFPGGGGGDGGSGGGGCGSSGGCGSASSSGTSENQTSEALATMKDAKTPAEAAGALRNKQMKAVQPWTRITHKLSPELTREPIPFLGAQNQFEKESK
ncbi:MAG: hypothetical protein LBE20_02390 [Deltaproteobacteria bacterium]|jgi:hypothetical protein|nr:hypothetical protein [Deltaproteobacteria bacterium]